MMCMYMYCVWRGCHWYCCPQPVPIPLFFMGTLYITDYLWPICQEHNWAIKQGGLELFSLEMLSDDKNCLISCLNAAVKFLSHKVVLCVITAPWKCRGGADKNYTCYYYWHFMEVTCQLHAMTAVLLWVGVSHCPLNRMVGDPQVWCRRFEEEISFAAAGNWCAQFLHHTAN